MSAKTSLSKQRSRIVHLRFDNAGDFQQIQDVIPSSRATRLISDPERFLKVSFPVELKGNLVRQLLVDKIKKGIIFLGKKYIFFGYTESQLKESRVLFFQEGEDWTVHSLKAVLGDLNSVYREYGYGKYAARLGLSFSSTVPALKVDLEDRYLLKDLMADDGSDCSDGCGMIRDSFANQVCSTIGVSDDTCVFQIRLGGIKGLFVRYRDEVFDRICGGGAKIAYRHSMFKYKDGPLMLEVQNVNRPPRSARLNIQFIVLLMTLGIPLEVFESLLRKQIDDLEQIMVNRQKAIDWVDGELDSEGSDFDQELYEMLLAGFDLSEGHLACLLKQFQKRSLDSLRTKLHIRVKDSAYLYGVVDELGILDEGQVYINLPYQGGPQVGTFLVARNPAYSPGDLRRLEAINVPGLSYLTNCIVFAGKGGYSEPSQMSGGDLDGDLYLILKDAGLVPDPEKIRSPKMKSDPTPSGPNTNPVEDNTSSSDDDESQSEYATPLSEDDASFSACSSLSEMNRDAVKVFMNLRGSRLLGQMSSAWMQQVGKTEELADQAYCANLVPLIEKVLDIAKTGENIESVKNQFYALKTFKRASSDTWKDPIKHLQSLVPNPLGNSQDDFQCDPDLILKGIALREEWDAYIAEGREYLKAFNKELSRAITSDKMSKATETRSSRFIGAENNETAVENVRLKYLERYFSVRHVLDDSRTRMLRASAWYFVGYENGKSAFSWLGRRWLNHIKALQSGNLPITVGMTRKPLIPVRREETEDDTSYYAPATSMVEDAKHDSDVTMDTASDDEGDDDYESFYSLSDNDGETPQVCRSHSPLGTESSRTSSAGSFRTCDTMRTASYYGTAEDTDVGEELPSIPRSSLNGGRAPRVPRQWSEDTLVDDVDVVGPVEKDRLPPSPISRPGPPRRGIRRSFGLSVDDAEPASPRPASPHLSSPPPTPPPSNRRAEKSRATNASPSSSGHQRSGQRTSRSTVDTSSPMSSRPPTPVSPRPDPRRTAPHPEKPRERVASTYPRCSKTPGGRHTWKINANAFQRTYACSMCGIKEKEKALKSLPSDGRRWEAFSVTG
ncbi:RNA dependent RNA polymerase-domain-containing protein [Armillaria novae-zelandiae]|uniref:RNA-dependent RNA polymerase n=1 Tax=Armillaria novae-zelandiae TaxID=153914 RepID=A0AA39UQ02_9AGAR|nr:RNA dependent RNA polymerase-domain-containing protein [Armillaria novae-zelandiae]